MTDETDVSVLFIEVSTIQRLLSTQMWHLKCPVYRGVLNSEVVKYTNVAFETDESVLFIEVS